MGNGVSVSIGLEDGFGAPKNIIAGSPLEGKVIVSSEQQDLIEIEPTEIALYLTGQEDTLIDKNASERTFFHASVRLRPNESYIYSPSRNNSNFMPIPFSIDLPPSLPATAQFHRPDGSGGQVKYKLQAKANRLILCSKILTVNAAPLPQVIVPYLVPPQSHKIKSNMGLSKKGTIRLGVSIRDSHVGRGQLLEMDMSCRNDATVDIERIQIKLVELVSWNANNHYETKKIPLGELKTVPVLPGMELQQKTKRQLQYAEKQDDIMIQEEMYQDLKCGSNKLQLMIPNNARDTYHGQIFKVIHYIKVVLCTKGYADDPSVKIPIKIGTCSITNRQSRESTDTTSEMSQASSSNNSYYQKKRRAVGGASKSPQRKQQQQQQQNPLTTNYDKTIIQNPLYTHSETNNDDQYVNTNQKEINRNNYQQQQQQQQDLDHPQDDDEEEYENDTESDSDSYDGDGNCNDDGRQQQQQQQHLQQEEHSEQPEEEYENDSMDEEYENDHPVDEEYKHDQPVDEEYENDSVDEEYENDSIDQSQQFEDGYNQADQKMVPYDDNHANNNEYDEHEVLNYDNDKHRNNRTRDYHDHSDESDEYVNYNDENRSQSSRSEYDDSRSNRRRQSQSDTDDDDDYDSEDRSQSRNRRRSSHDNNNSKNRSDPLLVTESDEDSERPFESSDDEDSYANQSQPRNTMQDHQRYQDADSEDFTDDASMIDENEEASSFRDSGSDDLGNESRYSSSDRERERDYDHDSDYDRGYDRNDKYDDDSYDERSRSGHDRSQSSPESTYRPPRRTNSLPLEPPLVGGSADDGENDSKSSSSSEGQESRYEREGPSIDDLFLEMEETADCYELISNKLEDPTWLDLLCSISPEEFGLIIAHVDLEFEQPRIAELIAIYLSCNGENQFTCDYGVAVLERTHELFRVNMVQAIAPHCVDLVQYHDRLRSMLNDMEQDDAMKIFESAIQERKTKSR